MAADSVVSVLDVFHELDDLLLQRCDCVLFLVDLVSEAVNRLLLIGFRNRLLLITCHLNCIVDPLLQLLLL